MGLPKHKKKEEFTSLDKTPGVAEFVLRRETVRWYETVLCKLHNTSWYRNILQGTRSGEYGNPRVLVLYQRRSLAESHPFPGNSMWCSAWLNSREDSGVGPKRGAVCSREGSRLYDVLSYTSGAAGGSGVIEILCLYQVSSMFCLYQVKSTFCLYQVKSTFCLYQVKSTFLFIPGGGVSLLTPASEGQRALGRPIYARRAIATAFS